MPISCNEILSLLRHCYSETPPADAGAVRVPRVPGGTAPLTDCSGTRTLCWSFDVRPAVVCSCRHGAALRPVTPMPSSVHARFQYPHDRLRSLHNHFWRSAGRITQLMGDSAGAATRRCAGVTRAGRRHPFPSRSAVCTRNWRLGSGLLGSLLGPGWKTQLPVNARPAISDD